MVFEVVQCPNFVVFVDFIFYTMELEISPSFEKFCPLHATRDANKNCGSIDQPTTTKLCILFLLICTHELPKADQLF